MLDLYNQKYDRSTLKANIYDVKLMDILITQHIDATFAARYILNEKYQLLEEDKKITYNMVLLYQPHINAKILYNAIIQYESDDDSIEDFETFSLHK
jgi:hypothetical protein